MSQRLQVQLEVSLVMGLLWEFRVGLWESNHLWNMLSSYALLSISNCLVSLLAALGPESVMYYALEVFSKTGGGGWRRLRQIERNCFQWSNLEFMAPCNQSFIHWRLHLCLLWCQQCWDDTCSSGGLLIVWRCSVVAHSFNILIQFLLAVMFCKQRLALLKCRADYRGMAGGTEDWQSSEQEAWTTSSKRSRNSGEDGERRDLRDS